MISLGFDPPSATARTGGGEHCRICREEGEDAKDADLRLAVPRSNIVKEGSGIGKGNDMDVIAVPCESSSFFVIS